MVHYKTTASPLLTDWRYCSPALSHRYDTYHSWTWLWHGQLVNNNTILHAVNILKKLPVMYQVCTIYREINWPLKPFWLWIDRLLHSPSLVELRLFSGIWGTVSNKLESSFHEWPVYHMFRLPLINKFWAHMTSGNFHHFPEATDSHLVQP